MGRWHIAPLGRALLACAAIAAATNAAAEPGNEALLHSADVKARLYLVEVHRDAGGAISGLRLAWVPHDIVKKCVGGTFAACRDLDQCVRYPGPACGVAKGRTRDPNVVPTRLLDTLITTTKRVAQLAKEWHLGPGTAGVETSLLEKERSLETRVHWEMWSNGEGLTVP